MDIKTVSISDAQAFENLLNRIDANIYVSDIDTNEVLFLNNKLKKDFGLSGDYRGKKCWEVLHKDFETACVFCPVKKLKADMSAQVVWEEESAATGKYYKHTSTIIDWVGGKKVHMQHSVDITDIRNAEEKLKRRLSQQKLMSNITQNFVGNDDIEHLIQKALLDVKEFWNADTVFIARDLSEEKCFEFILSSESVNGMEPLGIKVSYAGKEEAYSEITKGDILISENTAEIPDSHYIGHRPASHFRRIIVPISIKDVFYGYLEAVSYDMEYKWHDSERHLGTLLSGIFAIAMEKKERKKELFEAEQRLRTVIDNAPIAIFWKDQDSVYQGGNAVFSATAKLRADEISGKTDFDVVDEKLALKNIEDDKRILETGELFDVEHCLTHKGRKRWLHTIKAPIRDENGSPTGIIGLSEDITNRKEAEKQLAKMSAIVDKSPQYISYVDRNGNFDFVNDGTLAVTGYTREEIMKLGLNALYNEESQRKVHDELLPEIYRKGELSFELPIVRKNGEIRNMAFSSFVVESDEVLCASIAADITERVQLEEALIKEKELAEQASIAKSDFLSRMSHEIRTPMNAIIGMTKIAMGAPEKVDYCLEKIDGASKHLLGILNDILDMSKIEASKFDISADEFDLEKVIVDAVNIANFLAQDKDQTLAVKTDPKLPECIIGDELRLKQVITNLLSNAIKFTDKHGTITLRINRTGGDKGSSMIRFEVEDTGIGITEEQKGRIFNAFEQAEGSTTRKYGGTGLGLPICKKIVDLMGGDLIVESKPGEGSTFSFTLSFQHGLKSTIQALAEGIDRESLRILVVDDAKATREYCSIIFKGFGIERCDVAADGFEALEKVREQRIRGEQYNIVFVDWQMPQMDGIEVTKRIKEIVDDSTVVIMISVSEWSEIEKEAKAVGIKKFIPKPLFASTLMNVINEVTGVPSKDALVTDNEEYDFKGHTVLLAEDVEINREIIFALMEDSGLTIEYAENGEEALNIFRDNMDKFDAILMDIHMPIMNGYESATAIRLIDDPRAKSVPIIAMTANAFKEDVEKCWEVGMNAHIPKPVDPNELFRVLNEHLKH